MKGSPMDNIEIPNLKKGKVTDQIYHTLRKLILNKKWPAGNRVPSENDLASQFGVSRMSVRMALQKLQALGLIEVKVGDGSYVKEFSLDDFLSEIGEMAFVASDIRQVSEFRKAIELAALELAFARITNDDLAMLKEYLDKMMLAVKKNDDEEFIKWDFNFHRQICLMSGNNMFVTVYDICGSLMRKYYQINRYISPITSDDIENEDHVVLYRYICEGNYEKSAEQYRQMIDYPLIQNGVN
jgi:GntR family transcriptional repressor for pyruvate dehydrogenase complex